MLRNGYMKIQLLLPWDKQHPNDFFHGFLISQINILYPILTEYYIYNK